MSDFQKQTLKRWARNFLILCGIALLCYGGVKFELVRYAVLAILTLIVVGVFVWGLIRVARWDWWLRGKLTEDEYKAYQSCARLFGWRDDKYLPTEDQVYTMTTETSLDKDVLWSMYNKLTEGH